MRTFVNFTKRGKYTAQEFEDKKNLLADKLDGFYVNNNLDPDEKRYVVRAVKDFRYEIKV